MSDDAPNLEEAPVTFNIKSSLDARYVLTLPLTLTVLDLKNKLSGSDYADIPPDRQRLIYSGRVLKDADTLASYNIKEGNTVHLVKGAASNQRLNPSNSGPVASGSGTQTATGVPTNIAAGSGRDPLAALTGARYAGYAQMPNANMFGPDGGVSYPLHHFKHAIKADMVDKMGPPPDPEQMASMLENPNFASQLNEALSNPDIVEHMIRSNPMLQGEGAQQARQMLQDPSFRRMMTDPQMIRNVNNMRRQMPGMFGGLGGIAAMGGAGGEQAFPMPGSADAAPASEGGERGSGEQQHGNNAQQPSMGPFAMFGNPGAERASAGNLFAALFPRVVPAMGGNAAPAAGGQGGETAGAATGTDSSQHSQQGQQLPQNPFQAASQMLTQNPELMQQMMTSLGSASPSGSSNPSGSNNPQPFDPFGTLQALGGLGGFGGGGFGAPSPPSQPQDSRPAEDRYAEQLRQLNDMGFYEFERNVEALRRTGGSVQGAVEYLLTH
ncbi:MAG: hypothetical protein Q9163_004329 [Psora crenata]